MKLSRSLLGAVVLVALAGSAAAQQFDFPPVQYGGPFGSVGGGSAPSGLAGGDLSGSYPNPTVAKATMPSGGILSWNADTGISRDSVLGALNVDLGNGSANDKTGTLNAAKVALGGCTPGANVLCATGTGSFGSLSTSSGGLTLTGGAVLSFSTNGILSSPAVGTIQLGLSDGASPVAQTLGFQNVVAGTSNTAGAITTIKNSAGTGTGIGGNTVFQYAPHDTTHTVNTFTGSASPYTIGFTAGNITTYPIGTVMTVSGCTTATLNGTYTVTASSSGSVTATTTATGTGSPTTCLIVGNTSQNAWATALTINGDTGVVTFPFTPVFSGGLINVAGVGLAKDGNGILDSSNASASQYAQFNALAYGFGTTAAINTYLSSSSSGVAEIGTAAGNASGSMLLTSLTNSGALIAGGSAPTGSGTCTRGAQTGGNTTGTIVLTCTAQTLILTFTTTAPTGWMCEAIDQTTTADTMKQTSNTTTSCTLTGTTAASDVVLFQARAY